MDSKIDHSNNVYKTKIEIYLTQSLGKSIVTETFIRTLKNKGYIYMIFFSKNISIDKLDGIVNKYIVYHNPIKIPADVKPRTYIDFAV